MFTRAILVLLGFTLGVLIVRVFATPQKYPVSLPNASPPRVSSATSPLSTVHADGGSAAGSKQRALGINVATLRMLQRLSDTQEIACRASIIDWGRGRFALPDGIRKLLEINDEEAKAIVKSLAAVHAKFIELEKSVTQIAFDPQKNTLVVSVPPFPEQGQKLFSELTRELDTIISPERAALLWSFGEIDALFNECGLRNREITLSPGKEEGTLAISIVNYSVDVDPDGTTRRETHLVSIIGDGAVHSSQELMKALDPVGSLIPAHLLGKMGMRTKGP